jgi:amino acid adenylation domain-containing protein
LNTYHHFLVLISTGGANQAVSCLYPLTKQDLDQICQWNRHIPKSRNACLHNTVEEHAFRRPQAPAVCSWDGNLTFKELNMLSTKLAHHLSQLGVGPEIFVPYAFEKSMYAVVATLGILKAGGAFVPLDASHPETRLKSIISRVGATLIVASARTAQAFKGMVPHVIVVDQLLLDSLPEKEHNPYSAVSPSSSAFVLFTSGSTGEPKGVVQEHASVCSVNEAYRTSLYFNEDTRVLNFAAYTFDVSTVDVFTTLSNGGCVCIPSEEDRLNDIVRVINEFRVSWIDLTPSFALASFPRPDDIPTLQTLVLAGEEVKREHVAHFVGAIPRVINCYGPAEAGGCLANLYQSPGSQPQTVGTSLPNASCWIVDSKNPRQLAPIGAIGELVIEGSTLAREYLKDAAKTDAAFFNHTGWRPSKTCDQMRRFYRTGDLVQYRPDGLINYIGRQDTQ